MVFLYTPLVALLSLSSVASAAAVSAADGHRHEHERPSTVRFSRRSGVQVSAGALMLKRDGNAGYSSSPQDASSIIAAANVGYGSATQAPPADVSRPRKKKCKKTGSYGGAPTPASFASPAKDEQYKPKPSESCTETPAATPKPKSEPTPCETASFAEPATKPAAKPATVAKSPAKPAFQTVSKPEQKPQPPAPSAAPSIKPVQRRIVRSTAVSKPTPSPVRDEPAAAEAPAPASTRPPTPPAPTRPPTPPAATRSPAPPARPPTPPVVRPSTPAVPPPTAGLSEFESDCLATHNRFRAEFGKAPLAWSIQLRNAAQLWANTLAAERSFRHSAFDFGENLFQTTGGSKSCFTAVKAWFDEEPLYNNEPIGQGDFSAYGHFTQLVWPETTKLGCAFSDVGARTRNTVCEYEPAGNLVGVRMNLRRV
ncbi:CAP domain-containing protein [Entophlyctis helioformis]|nr:CAP domain-containing protein [Entophlyctis helioformis]